MDLLNEDDGYILIESLVSIVVLGFAVIFFSMFFARLYKNSAFLLKGEAYTLASQEINNSLNFKSYTDTTYNSAAGNMIINRRITETDSMLNVSVVVLSKSNSKEIVRLSALVKPGN